MRRPKKLYFKDITTGSLMRAVIDVVQGTTDLVGGIVMILYYYLFLILSLNDYSSMTVHCCGDACISCGFHFAYLLRLHVTKCLIFTYMFSY